jgi:hypothetical protein
MFMKRLHLHTLLLLTLWASACFGRADDQQLLNGKWSAKRLTEDGLNCTQIITITPGKFTFQRIGPDHQMLLRAEGDLKFEKLGPFSALRCWHMRGAEGSGDLEDVDDEYVLIYTLDEDTWTVASNFDKQRDEKPSLEVYHRTKTPRPADAKDAPPAAPPGKH